VKVMGAPYGACLYWLPSGMPYVALPGASWSCLGALVIWGVLRLLFEWQVRVTLIALVERSPGGTVVVVMSRGLGGRAMWVQVGNGSRPEISPPVGRSSDG
jgi:hypothetical protein